MTSKKIIVLIGTTTIAVFLCFHSLFAEKIVFVVPFLDKESDASIGRLIAEKIEVYKHYDVHFKFSKSEKPLNIMSNDEVNFIIEKMQKERSAHILGGMVERSYGNGYLIKSVLLNVKKKQKEYMTEYFIQTDEQIDEAAKAISGRCALFLANKWCDKIESLSVVPDEEKGSIIIKWNKIQGIEEYVVYRAALENGPYIKIAEVKSESEYADNSVVRGIEYRYGVSPILNGILCDPFYFTATHLRMPLPQGLKIEEEKKKKTVSDKQIANELKNDIVKKHLEFLSGYYMHPVKLNLALYIGRSYIEKGQVIALSYFDDYEIDREKKYITLIGKNKSYIVGMAAASFFLFLERAEEKKVPEISVLINRLLKNAIAYAIPRDEKPIKDEYGHTVYVPYYEAIGLSTEYFKNYAKWDSNTVMMSTSDEELKKKIKAAQQKGVGFE